MLLFLINSIKLVKWFGRLVEKMQKWELIKVSNFENILKYVKFYKNLLKYIKV